MRPVPSRVLPAVLLLAVVAVARPAAAASCCGSILAFADRLAPGDQAAVLLSVSGLDAVGRYDGRGRFIGTGSQSVDLAGRLSVTGSFRLAPTWQLSGNVGWLEGWRSEGAASSVGGGFTDVTLGARWEPAALDRWALAGQLTVPTGRTIGESTTALAADVTGRGAAAARIGVAWERPIDQWFFVVQGAAEVSGPMRDGGISGGFGADVIVVGGRQFSNAAALSMSLRESLNLFLSEGAASPATHGLSLTLSGGWPLSDSWTISGSVVLDPPVTLFGRHRNAMATATIGLRRVL